MGLIDMAADLFENLRPTKSNLKDNKSKDRKYDYDDSKEEFSKKNKVDKNNKQVNNNNKIKRKSKESNSIDER